MCEIKGVKPYIQNVCKFSANISFNWFPAFNLDSSIMLMGFYAVCEWTSD